MRVKRGLGVVLLVFMLTSLAPIPAIADDSLSSYRRDPKHWVYDELADFKQKIVVIVGPGSTYTGISEEDKEIIRKNILSEDKLDTPIKAQHWAVLLNAVLMLPKDKKDELLKTYVYGVAPAAEISREMAVGGMVKLLSVQYLKPSTHAEDLEPAKKLKDLGSIPEPVLTHVSIACAAGLLDATATEYFRPKHKLTAAEAISMLRRVVLKYGITYSAGAPQVAIPKDARWLESEVFGLRDRLQRQAEVLRVLESSLVGGMPGSAEKVYAPVSMTEWKEALRLVLRITDDKILDQYTVNLHQGQVVPRDIAVAGLVKLLHYNGAVKGRDASEQERRTAAAAFLDYESAFDTSKLAIAYTEGLIKGYPDKTFRSGQPLTRGEALILMLNLLRRLP